VRDGGNKEEFTTVVGGGSSTAEEWLYRDAGSKVTSPSRDEARSRLKRVRRDGLIRVCGL